MVSEEAGERLAQQAAGPGLSHFSLALEPQLLTARHAAPGGRWFQQEPGVSRPRRTEQVAKPERGACAVAGSAVRCGGGGGLGVLGAVISSTEE